MARQKLRSRLSTARVIVFKLSLAKRIHQEVEISAATLPAAAQGSFETSTPNFFFFWARSCLSKIHAVTSSIENLALINKCTMIILKCRSHFDSNRRSTRARNRAWSCRDRCGARHTGLKAECGTRHTQSVCQCMQAPSAGTDRSAQPVRFLLLSSTHLRETHRYRR